MMIEIDGLSFRDPVLTVACHGHFGIGSTGNPSGVALKGAIDRWMSEHEDEVVKQVDVDFREVDYEWGDGPVSSMVPLLMRGVERVRLLAGSKNARALENLVDGSDIGAAFDLVVVPPLPSGGGSHNRY